NREAYTFAPFKIVRCNNCTAFYLSPRLEEQAAIRLYENEDYFNEAHESGYSEYTEQEPALRKTFQRFMENLKKEGPTGGRLLEIGCGFGYLLDEAQPYFSYRAGTDFSSGAVARAEQVADAVYLGDVSAVPAEDRFDCIVATNVLEHTYAPANFLHDLHARLNPGGCIVMAVPNMASFLRFVLHKKWPSFKVPEHTIYFDQTTLQRVFRQAELTQIAPFSFPHAFSIKLIVGKFGINLSDSFNEMSIWVPTTMTATIGYKADDA
ncbi:MAG: class I SAM-dependent methyltransferase, partial [Chloroflexota bacterium]